MDRPTCKTCPHWYDLGEEDPNAPEGNMGTCERFPAVPVYAVQVGTDKLLQNWDQPEMSWWQSCGEHPDFPAYLAGLRSSR